MTGFKPDFINAVVRASPNFGPRHGIGPADMLILHYTGMESGELAENWLADPRSEVSSHYLVHEDGRIVQMVSEKDRAWHAGRSFWGGETDINSRSVGIEIVNPGHAGHYPDFPGVQIDAVIALCRDIVERLGICGDRVLAHSDVAPGRKIDPGEKFPWRRLADAGIGIFPEETPVPPNMWRLGPGQSGRPVEQMQADLALFGYGLDPTGAYDSQTRTVVEAFQRHFRPKQIDGIADAETLARLSELLRLAGRQSPSVPLA